MTQEGRISKIIIVGAGPSGLLLASLLAKDGVRVQILDQGAGPEENPRAAHYAPSAVYDFERAGVRSAIQARGFSPDGFCWRESNGKELARMCAPADYDLQMVVLPLDRLIKVLTTHLEKFDNVEVNWNHKVVGIEQDEKEARVKVETPDGPKVLGADYVVGADGASSQVRRSLFGEEYPGETLKEQIVATNVYYDFKAKHGYGDVSFIIHPTNWYMAAKITNEGLWRFTYGDIPGLTTEEYRKRNAQRVREILPSPPNPEEFTLDRLSPYKLQQRCAPSFRVGRFALVADAAHLCNPFGGLGLTGGFADAGSLYDCLIGIHRGLTDDSILDKYSEIRIKIWREMIDPMSRTNFLRLWHPDAVPEKEEWFSLLKQASEDVEFNRAFTNDIHRIRHDFTQYYNVDAKGRD